MRKYKIGVSGSMMGHEEKVLSEAFSVGEEIAKSGSILFYGACVGYPHEAAVGALSQNGLVVGVSPALNREEHIHDFAYTPDDKEVILYSGIGKHARDVIFIRSTDAVIFIGGAEGSLLEYCVAYGNNKVIGILTGSGGVTDHLEEITKTFYKKPGIDPIVIKDSDSKTLVKLVLEQLINTE